MRVYFILLVVATMLGASCSSKKVMRECEPMGDGFYLCEKP